MDSTADKRWWWGYMSLADLQPYTLALRAQMEDIQTAKVIRHFLRYV